MSNLPKRRLRGSENDGRAEDPVPQKRVRRWVRLMGLEGVYPEPRLSKSSPEHLLKGRAIDHPDSAWCSDITYSRMLDGVMSLVAVMNWHSRYVLSWEISTTMDTAFCIRTLEKALVLSRPENSHTDEGPQSL